MIQLVKNPLAMWQTWARSLGCEDPLEKEKATHSSILAWRSPWGCKESDMTEQLSLTYQARFKVQESNNNLTINVQIGEE